jgi:hypothetical protein
MVLVPLTSEQLERLDQLIEQLMELRDLLDGDIDLEDGDQDRCAACDDAPISGPSIGCRDISCEYAGNEDDAEDNHDAEDEDSTEWQKRVDWLRQRRRLASKSLRSRTGLL